MKSIRKNKLVASVLSLFMLCSCSFFGGGEEQTAYTIKELDDFSFLDDKSDALPDSNGGEYDSQWYPGVLERDPDTGEVTVEWDRDPVTLACLDEYGAIYRGDESRPVVYFTFDCGYEYTCPEYPEGVTNAILDVLKEKDVPGTFFVTGEYIENDTEIIKRMLDEGHVVGNHTLNHLSQTSLSPEEFQSELIENNKLLKEKIPEAPDMIYYRPPEGDVSEKTLAEAHAMGCIPVFWSCTQNDYNAESQPDPEETLYADEMSLHNGCVYLLHAVSTTNAQILGDLIDFIREEGFEIEPLPNTLAEEEETQEA